MIYITREEISQVRNIVFRIEPDRVPFWRPSAHQLLQVFVLNRDTETFESAEVTQWRHAREVNKSADLLTQPASIKQLKDHPSQGPQSS